MHTVTPDMLRSVCLIKCSQICIFASESSIHPVVLLLLAASINFAPQTFVLSPWETKKVQLYVCPICRNKYPSPYSYFPLLFLSLSHNNNKPEANSTVITSSFYNHNGPLWLACLTDGRTHNQSLLPLMLISSRVPCWVSPLQSEVMKSFSFTLQPPTEEEITSPL
jgi:hypothetical protein